MRKTALLVLATCLGLAAVEGVARLARAVALGRAGATVEPPRAELSGLGEARWADYDRLPYAVLRPYVMFAPGPGFRSPTVNINELGLRGRSPARPKPRGTRRIVVLGGSAAFGTGASSDEATFPARLEALLRGHGDARVEVVNAGSPAFVSGQELARAVFELPELEPDVVVVYDGFNDLSSPLLFDPRPGYPSNFAWLEQSSGFNSLRRVIAYRLGAAARASAIGFWARRWTGERDGAPLAPSGADDAILAAYRRNVERMVAVLRASGARVLCVFQPTLFGKEPRSAAEQAVLEHVERRHAGYGERMRALLPRAAAAMAQACAGRARFADLTPVFAGEPGTVFFDTAHVTDAGNRRIAERLAGELEAMS